MVGRLVEHEQVDPARLQQGKRRPGAFAGRERRGGAGDVVADEPELRQQGAHVGVRPLRELVGEDLRERAVTLEPGARLVDLADQHPGAERGAAGIDRRLAEQGGQQGGLAGAVGPGDADPVAEVELQVDRPEGEAATVDDGTGEGGDDLPGARCGGDAQPQLPLLARLVDDLEPFDHPVGLTGLGRLLLGGGDRVVPDELVLLDVARPAGAAAGGPHPLVRPGPLGAGPVGERVPGAGVLLVRLTGVPPGDLALLEVGVVATAVGRHPLQAAVDLDDGRHGRGQEGPVVADQHHRLGPLPDEGLDELQPVGVQVVGRLVEEVDVVAGEQQAGEPGPGGLAPGQRGDLAIEVGGQPDPGEHLGGALVEIGAAEGEPVLQRLRVPVRLSGILRVRGHRLGRGIHRDLRGSDAGSPGQRLADGLPRRPVRGLGEQADPGLRRAGRHLALERLQRTGEDVQQGRLARAVRPDQPDHLAGTDDEVELVHEGARAPAHGHASGLDRRAHGRIIAPAGAAAQRVSDGRGVLPLRPGRGHPPAARLRRCPRDPATRCGA